jgi:NADH-quinone oxidoreductase subunit N
MNAPLIWIGLPACAAVCLWFTSQRRMLTTGLASGFCLLFAFLAWRIPIGSIINLGFFSLEIAPNFVILGRQFVLSNNDRGILIFLFSFGAFWFFGAGIGTVHRLFIPTGMGLVSLSVSALAVEPFLYAALVVEVMVLVSIPMLVVPGQRVGQGVLRYLIFQTLALPFVLLAGWAVAGVDANPANDKLLIQAVVLLGLGLAFWLAVFPFHTWLPILMEETHSYANGFLISLLQCVALLLVLKFLDSFTWLRNYLLLREAFLVTGTIMVFTSGVWAIFQTDLRRIFSYGVILESGLSLLALGSGTSTGPKILVALFLSRTLAFGLWILAITIFSRSGRPDFTTIRGKLKTMPLTSLALIVGVFSTAGLPVLGGFPVRLALIETLGIENSGLLPWVFLGMIGFLFSGVRVMAALARSDDMIWQTNDSWLEGGLIIISIIGLLVIGVFPNWLLPIVIKLLQAFENLG